MRTGIALLHATAALLLAAVALPAAPQERGSLRLAEWNVENLFDTVHDEGFRDEEFLPAGERRWTPRRYRLKLADVARGIAAVAEGDGRIADIVALCEVENDSVMTALVRRSPLRTLAYDYVITQSLDRRGIDVALLYQPARFRLLGSRSIRIPTAGHGLSPTRDILYARGLTFTRRGTDTLHVFAVHLPSRVGGTEGDRKRRLAAETLWAAIDSLPREAHIVLMGDFNAGSDDRIFRRSPLRCTDDPDGEGTYAFRGLWQWLDHILVSETVETTTPARTLRLPWMVEKNMTYGGDMPRRTFRGPTYHGGVSDHLPLVIDVVLR